MITVIFSSHNGARVLPRMLAALARVRAPAGGWRAIAIDNASNDETADLLRSYRDRIPMLVLREAEPGKSHALNKGLAHAEGDLFVFCDDDVVVSEDWLESWRAVADAHPTYSLFGGLTLPLWPSPPPDWIVRDVNIPVVYAVHQDAEEGACKADCMHGANMAIRAHAFAAGARFNVGIGPDGSDTYAMGSETEFAVRLEASGHRCWFSVKPAARHIIRAGQLAPDWILRRAYRFGRGEGLMRRPHPVGPRRLAAKNALKSLLYPAALALHPERTRWRRRWQWAFDMGYEDARRERSGLAPVWRDRAARLLAAPDADSRRDRTDVVRGSAR